MARAVNVHKNKVDRFTGPQELKVWLLSGVLDMIRYPKLSE